MLTAPDNPITVLTPPLDGEPLQTHGLDCVSSLGVATGPPQHWPGTGQEPEESLVNREWVRKLASMQAGEIRGELFPNCVNNRPSILSPELSPNLSQSLL